ncbi:MAG: DNA mismatch repair protein MutS [Thermodesulfovibrionales bacterium]|nr:DNA mismatch repair protein MutS [Thermodesulfovibrionales bacterium]
MSELTPLMKQYSSIKEKHKDCILMFRLGDFYEMFGEDARIASKILQIALTSRDKSKEEPMPMCGIPHFASETYITKLIKAGHKVAICEQMEDAKEAKGPEKGIIQRDVVRVITPGTHAPEHPKENNYIISFFPDGKKHGIAAADISTGEFVIYETLEPVEDEISRFEPREIVCPKTLKENIHYSEILKNFYTTAHEDWAFDYAEAYRTLLMHFKVSSLDGYGCEGMNAAISAAGALVNYLEDTQKENLNFKKISTLQQASFMLLDAATQRNLELIHNLKNRTEENTLLWALDETLTSMGGRYLRGLILRPFIDIKEIHRRQGAVEHLVGDYELIEVLRSNFRKVQDLERLSNRVATKSANPRDLIAIKNSISHLPSIKKALLSSQEPYLKSIADEISEFSLMKSLIEAAVMDNPPLSLRDGGIVKKGYNKEIDELRKISNSGKDFIAELEMDEKKKTGISSLKVGYNRIFGYYIEVTKTNLEQVPDYYIRKQTLAGGERFITPELKEYESKVLGAEEKLKNLEYQVFNEILDEVQKESFNLAKTAHAIAAADFLTSMAVAAKRHNYVKPVIDESGVIEILDGRHPVLERIPGEERFVSNSIHLDIEGMRLMIITGPNMAGKSTYMRQIALIVLMAQMGGFVPASEARIGIVDRIFTRIGASDFITKGQSTFMVEMVETANILNNASSKSLIIIDEVGRGTSTFDGISIAWAVAEHIAKTLKARTLFATHYNELTELSLMLDGVKNYNVSVKEWGDEIIFLRKVEEGPADKSYGIQVARLAGLPAEVIGRAKEVLTNLEKEELNETGEPKFAGRRHKKGTVQLDLFAMRQDPLSSEIMNLDMEKLTPQEALHKLKELKKKLET